MKGVSPLLAGILLIAITVTVASLASGWLTSTIRSSTDTTTNRTDTALLCSGASIAIEDVYIVGTTSATITASVRNNGQIDDLVIQSAQVFNTTGGNFTLTTATPITDVDRGSIVQLSFVTGAFAACPGDFSELIVTTQCGGIIDTFTATPKCN